MKFIEISVKRYMQLLTAVQFSTVAFFKTWSLFISETLPNVSKLYNVALFQVNIATCIILKHFAIFNLYIAKCFK